MDTNPFQFALIVIFAVVSVFGTVREIVRQGRADAAAKAEELRRDLSDKLRNEILVQNLREHIAYLEDELRKCLGYVPHPRGETHITVGRDLIGRDVTKRDDIGGDKVGNDKE